MKLSRFFTLDELTFSTTARAEGIDNQPAAAEIDALQALCDAVLDPLREALGKPIKVTSGYRGPVLNRRVKGAAKSQHLRGEAADLQSPGTAVLDLFQQVIRLGLPFDQLIYEVNGAAKWVHVSHSRSANAGEILLGKFDADGKVTYPRLTAQQALALTEARPRGRGVEPGYLEMGDEPRQVARKAGGVTAAAAEPVVAAEKSPAKKEVAKNASVDKVVAPKKPAPHKPAARSVGQKPAGKKIAKKKAPAKRTP